MFLWFGAWFSFTSRLVLNPASCVLKRSLGRVLRRLEARRHGGDARRLANRRLDWLDWLIFEKPQAESPHNEQPHES